MAIDKIINNITTRLPIVGGGCKVCNSFSECVDWTKTRFEASGLTVTKTTTNMSNGANPSKKQVFYVTHQGSGTVTGRIDTDYTGVLGGLIEYDQRYLMTAEGSSIIANIFPYKAYKDANNNLRYELRWEWNFSDGTYASDGVTIRQQYEFEASTFIPLIIYDSGHTYIGGIYILSTTNPIDRPTTPNVIAKVVCSDFWGYTPELVDPVPPEQDPELPPQGGPGGYNTPSGDDESDTIGLPDKPIQGFCNSGCGHVYLMNSEKLSHFVQRIFPSQEIDDTLTGIDKLAAMAEFIYKSFDNMNIINFVIDCHVVPVIPSTTADESIVVGYKELITRAPVVTSDWVNVSLGYIEAEEYYTNFLDYIDTEVQLYLPFIGFVPLQPEFLYGKILVDYTFNVISGDCVAHVRASSKKSNLTESIVGEYHGSCITHIPIQGTNYASMISSQVSAVGGIARGDVGQIGQFISSTPSFQKSNSYSSSGCNMMYKTPYLLIGRGVSQYSSNYAKENGLPLNGTYKLQDVHGFTKCTIKDLSIESAMQSEIEEIKRLCESGIYLE